MSYSPPLPFDEAVQLVRAAGKYAGRLPYTNTPDMSAGEFKKLQQNNFAVLPAWLTTMYSFLTQQQLQELAQVLEEQGMLRSLPTAALLQLHLGASLKDSGTVQQQVRLALKGSLTIGGKLQAYLTKLGGCSFHDGIEFLPDNIPADWLAWVLGVSGTLTPKQASVVLSNWGKYAEGYKSCKTTEDAANVSKAAAGNISLEYANDPTFETYLAAGGSPKAAVTATDIQRFAVNIPSIPFPAQTFTSGSLSGAFLHRTDPRGIALGLETNCCQHIEGAGAYSAVHGAVSPRGGFFRVWDKQDRTVAQSWIWLGNNSVCFDNVEMLEFTGKDAAANKARYIAVEDIYTQAAKALGSVFGGTITLGTGYTDSSLFKDMLDCEQTDSYFYSTLTYSDAANVKILHTSDKTFDTLEATSDLVPYVRAGIYDLNYIHELQQAGITGVDARDYYDAGVAALDDMVRLKHARVSGIGAGDYYRAGVTNVEYMLKFKKVGVDGIDALDYYDAGVKTLEGMIELGQAGIHGFAASRYSVAGISSPDDMVGLSKEGIGGIEAGDYYTSGIINIKDMIRLKQTGVDGVEARYYYTSSITEPEDMLRLKQEGIDGVDASGYYESGITVLNDMFKFKQAGITGVDAQWYRAAGEISLDDMLKLQKAGIKGAAASSYWEAGVTTVEGMFRLNQAGVRGSEAQWYYAAGIAIVEDMIKLKQAGIYGGDAQDYYAAGITTVEGMIKDKKVNL